MEGGRSKEQDRRSRQAWPLGRVSDHQGFNWVINLGYGQWIARCGNDVCNPTNLAEAKRQALAMAVGGIGDYRVSESYRGVSAALSDHGEPLRRGVPGLNAKAGRC